MATLVLRTLLLFALLGSGGVSAKTIKSSLDDLLESIEQLTVIKNSGKAPSEEKSAVEINARTATFNRVLDLASEELKELERRMDKIDRPNQEQYANLIGEYLNYYEIIRGQINREISLNELVDIAARFKKWRETDYAKEIKKVADFVLVYQNQEMIRVAKNRLERISADFKTIRGLIMPNQWGLAEKFLADAKNLIEEAEQANSEAQKKFEKITLAYKNFIMISKMIR